MDELFGLPTPLKLVFRCVRCKEILGVYEGKDFWLTSKNKWFSDDKVTVLCLCCGCYNQTKAEAIERLKP